MKGNIIADCGARPRSRKRYSLMIADAEHMDVQNNLIKDSIGVWAKVNENYYGNFFGNNDVVNSGGDMLYFGNKEDVDGTRPTDTNNYYSTPELAGYTEDYVFTTDRFTNNPRKITLEKVLKPN